ncbi:MAG TPA: nitrate- and nitrite sensing domain-containing protein [Actinocatenispora sp.]
MSKRQKTIVPAKRRRGPLARLRDARIRTKLGLIVVVPITALVGLASVRLVGTGQDVWQARDAIRYAQLADRAADLGDDLQRERTLAAVLLTTTGSRTDANKQYMAEAAATDKRVTAYHKAVASLGTPAANLTGLLARIDTQIDSLPALRRTVTERNVIPLSTAVFSYRSLIADLLAYRQTLANVAGSVDAANLARGASAIGSYTELTSQEQEVGTVILAGGGDVTPAQHEAFQATLSGQAEALHGFGDAVDTRHVADMEHTIAGKGVGRDAPVKLPGTLGAKTTDQVQNDIRAAQRFEGDMQRAPAGYAVVLSGDAKPTEWTRTMTTRIALSREVEKQLAAEFHALIQDQEQSLVRELSVESAIVSLMVLLAIMIALMTARSMSRSLHSLREGALTVAYESLPQSVARLRDPGALTELRPEDVVAGVPDVTARGRDEIGHVTEAFNVVHREAVRIAAEEATLRGGVSTMFVNLARRSQLMVDRLIGRLDRLERGEEDPDRLGELFHLDHLATQMRRNDENLLVLAGARPDRARRGAAPLGDLLRAAQSQVEQYTRVELGVVDVEVDVAGPAVDDLVHLIAELLDNATAFSAPDTVVTAEARWIGNRAFVTIADEGTGISPDTMAKLNKRLAEPPPVDVTLSRTMGLVVVGRLAERFGASVELRAQRDRGTIAEVVIPSDILQERPRKPLVDAPPARRPSADPYAAFGATGDGPYDRGPIDAAELAPADGARFSAFGSTGTARRDAPDDTAFSAFGTRGGSAHLRGDAPGHGPSGPGDGAYGPGEDAPPSWPVSAEDTPPRRPAAGTDVPGPPSRPGAEPRRLTQDLPTRRPGPAARPPTADRRPPAGAGLDDDTMEMRVFRTVEAGWFRTAAPGTPQADRPAPPPHPRETPLPARRETAPPATGHAPPSADLWRTVADDGWRAASSLGTADTAEPSVGGLPRRRPMAQLVPGSVEPAPARPSQHRRSADSVRGVLSAYQRGVQRGRTGGETIPPG